MLTRTTKNAKTHPTSTPPQLPRWDDDAAIRQARDLIAKGEEGLPGIEQRAIELRAQYTAASAALGEASTLLGYGIGSEAQIATQRADVEALGKEAADAEKQAATIRQGIEQHRAALPALEARARARVAGECEAIYVHAAEAFTAAVENAARAYLTLVTLHDQLAQAFPGSFNDAGEGFHVHALGMVRPPHELEALRPPEATWAPQAQPLYVWRNAMRQMRGTPAQTSEG